MGKKYCQDKEFKEFFGAPITQPQIDKNATDKLKLMRKQPLSGVQALDILNFAITHDSTFHLSLDEDNKEFSKEFKYLNEIFGWSPRQCLLMALQYNTDDGQCPIGMYQNAFHCSFLKVMKYNADFDDLVDKEYIFVGNAKRTFYQTNEDAFKSFLQNKPYTHTDKSDVSVMDILLEVRNKMFYNCEPESAMLYFSYIQKKYCGHKLFTLMDNIFIAEENIGNEKVKLCLLAIIANKVFGNYPHFSVDYLCSNLIEGYHNRICICKTFQNVIDNQEKMFKNPKILENDLVEGMAQTNTFVLSNEGAKYFGIADFLNDSGNANRALKKHEKIAKKELFYDAETQAQIDSLFDFLTEKNFKNIQQRLEKKNMRIGFNILLYGSAGTGKTETCLQLSKATKRDLFIVEVNNFKDKYVGESEKRIKAIFTQYNNIVEDYKVKGKQIPIMLLNEADAIIGIRKKGAENAVDKMENSVQNIILQEMENIKGIMIATTNLTENLDSAFERRFLYKIKYSNPSKETMCHIWKSNKIGLKDKDIQKLADNYSLSGGEIENIVRKTTIENILSGKKITYDMVCKFAEHEKLNKANNTKIGFNI